MQISLFSYFCKILLTNVSKISWNWINANRNFINKEVDLDIGNRWDRLNGKGVYIKKRSEWFDKDENGNLIGLNCDMTLKQAMKCSLLLTKLGHPDHVDKEFWRVKKKRNQSIEEIEEIICGTFEIRKQKSGLGLCMGQYLPKISSQGVLKIWFVNGQVDELNSDATTDFNYFGSRFLFESRGKYFKE